MIILEPIFHRETLSIAIRGKYKASVFQHIQRLVDLRYSVTHKCYYTAFSDPLLHMFRRELPAMDGDFQDLWDERLVHVTLGVSPIVEPIAIPPPYHEHLIKRRYSEATVLNYEAQFRAFLNFIYPKTADEFADPEIHAYQLYLTRDKKVSHSTQNQAINAIKFYLEQVKKGERREYYIERPRQECKLPTVLSEREVRMLFEKTHYIKHKCMLMMLYAAGLRRSELLNLKLADIDPDRKLIHVRGGKGRKDRVTLFSMRAYEVMSEYMELIKPKVWLFEGADGGRYSASSLNNIIRRSAERAGIKKRISAHTLRHTFATHLLENGTDLRYIQSLLGHENSKTTERYTQVTRKGFEGLISPLDRMLNRGEDKTDI